MVCLQLQNSGADAELRMQGDTAQKGTLKKTDLKDSGGGERKQQPRDAPNHNRIGDEQQTGILTSWKQ